MPNFFLSKRHLGYGRIKHCTFGKIFHVPSMTASFVHLLEDDFVFPTPFGCVLNVLRWKTAANCLRISKFLASQRVNENLFHVVIKLAFPFRKHF